MATVCDIIVVTSESLLWCHSSITTTTMIRLDWVSHNCFFHFFTIFSSSSFLQWVGFVDAVIGLIECVQSLPVLQCWLFKMMISWSLWCELADRHHIAEQYLKTNWTKIHKDLIRRVWSWNTCQDLFITACWVSALETDWSWFSMTSWHQKSAPICFGHQASLEQSH